MGKTLHLDHTGSKTVEQKQSDRQFQFIYPAWFLLHVAQPIQIVFYSDYKTGHRRRSSFTAVSEQWNYDRTLYYI